MIQLPIVTQVIPENVMKPKDWIVHRSILLDCGDLLNHFCWTLGKTKTTENTKATNDKVGDSHDKRCNKGLTVGRGKTKKAAEVPSRDK